MNRDPIYICLGLIFTSVWAIMWHQIPPDYKIIYVFILPIIVIPVLYLIFVRNRFFALNWIRGVLYFVVIVLGLAAFCQAILKFDFFPEIFLFYKK